MTFKDPRADIDEEIGLHLQARIDHLVAQGLSPEAARAEYGVVLAPAGTAVDHDATKACRDALRAARGEDEAAIAHGDDGRER